MMDPADFDWGVTAEELAARLTYEVKICPLASRGQILTSEVTPSESS